jgi:cystathionine gamma-synthase
MTNRLLSPATRAAQALRIIDPVTGAVVPGIEPASTYARDEDYAPRQNYIYGRDGGPTVVHAEAVMASLDEAAGSMIFASGMAAIVAVLETLNIGDHVVAPKIMYHGVINWLKRLQERRGILVTFFDTTLDGALEAAIQPNTKLVWIETPTNPSWDVIDIASAANSAHLVGAKLVVDSTIAAPCTMQALNLGADLVFQSATKYLGGHSDLTAGVLSVKQPSAWWDEIRVNRTLMGSVIAAFEAWLLIRGIRTLFIRYERASSNAMTLAKHLQGHPKIARVLYPGLPDHPRHAIAARQMQHGFGGMLSILTLTEVQARNVSRFCQVFIPATSLGGVESLIEHRKAVEGPNSIVPPELIRISVGIEDVSDLITDFDQALERA